MELLQLQELLGQLVRSRPVFHSEADFQHALAWEVHLQHAGAQIRLERQVLPGQYLDIALLTDGRRTAIELKYLTRRFQTTVHGEAFALQQQGAQDIRRYDVIKDVQRVETFLASGVADAGFVLVLTNDRGFWQQPARVSTVDAAFRIHEDRELAGELAWSTQAGAGTTHGREGVLALSGRYRLKWRDYSVLAPEPGGQFRYLAIEVQQTRPAAAIVPPAHDV